MEIDFSTLKEEFNDKLSNINYYFSHLGRDELYAWSAIGAGMLLIMAGFILM